MKIRHYSLKETFSIRRSQFRRRFLLHQASNILISQRNTSSVINTAAPRLKELLDAIHKMRTEYPLCEKLEHVIQEFESNVEHHKNYVTSIPSSNPRDIFANDEIR